MTPGQTDKAADKGGVATAPTAETTASTNQEKSAPASQAGDETPDENLKDAEAHAGQVADDQSHNYTSFVHGQSQEVTMQNGATVSLDNDIISNKDSETMLRLTGAAQAGKTYTILIPTVFATRVNTPELPPAYGNTSIFLHNADGHEYLGVVYNITKDATLNQYIPLVRNTAADIRKLFDDSDKVNYYREYDLIAGQIQVIHNNEVQKLTVNYQLPNVFVNGSEKLALEDIGDNRVGNGLDINLQIPVELGHMYISWDLFGTIPVTIPNFSFDIQGPKGQNIADWIKLNSETGKITDQNGERGTFHVSLAPQGNNVIKVNITDVTPLAVTSWNIGNH